MVNIISNGIILFGILNLQLIFFIRTQIFTDPPASRCEALRAGEHRLFFSRRGAENAEKRFISIGFSTIGLAMRGATTAGFQPQLRRTSSFHYDPVYDGISLRAVGSTSRRPLHSNTQIVFSPRRARRTRRGYKILFFLTQRHPS